MTDVPTPPVPHQWTPDDADPPDLWGPSTQVSPASVTYHDEDEVDDGSNPPPVAPDGPEMPDELAIGFNPARWGTRYRGFRDALQEATAKQVRDTMAAQVAPLPVRDREHVDNVVDNAVRESIRVGLGLRLAAIMVTRFVVTIDFVALVTAMVLPFWLPQSEPWWEKIFGSLTAFFSFYLSGLFSRWINRHGSNSWLGLLRAAIVPVPVLVLAFLPARIPHLWSWLSTSWLHYGLVATALTFTAEVLVAMALGAILGLVWARVTRRFARREPEQVLIGGVTAMVISMPDPDPSADADPPELRKQYVAATERMAGTFERNWPRTVRTGYPFVDEAARTWARQVAAGVRGEQLSVLIGRHRLAELKGTLISFVIAFVRRDRSLEREINVTAERISWLRRVFRGVLVLVLGAAGLLLLAAAALQPGLPDLLTHWHLTSMAHALSLSDELRAGAGAAGVGSFSLLSRVLAPEAPTTAPAGRRLMGG